MPSCTRSSGPASVIFEPKPTTVPIFTNDKYAEKPIRAGVPILSFGRPGTREFAAKTSRLRRIRAKCRIMWLVRNSHSCWVSGARMRTDARELCRREVPLQFGVLDSYSSIVSSRREPFLGANLGKDGTPDTMGCSNLCFRGRSFCSATSVFRKRPPLFHLSNRHFSLNFDLIFFIAVYPLGFVGINSY